MQKASRPNATHNDSFLVAHGAKIINVAKGFSGTDMMHFRSSIIHLDWAEYGYFCTLYPSFMELNKETTLKIAQLAKLSFSEKELEEIQQDLSQMIGFVEKLNEIDTTGVQPLTHISGSTNRLRADDIKGSISSEEAFKNAPFTKEDFFTVPKVIKK